MFQSLFKFLIILIIITSSINAETMKKKVVYINSYHKGFFWSDTIQKSILDTFNITEKNGKLDFSKSQIELKILEMDSKRNNNESYIKKTAFEIQKIIKKYKPDLIITSDDNAIKYIIVPYFYNDNLPILFCGVNADASVYGLPTKNITGMIEVGLIKELVEVVEPYARGNKIGYIGDSNLSSKKNATYFNKILNTDIKTYFAKSKKEWKAKFLLAQKEVDILITAVSAGVLHTEEDINEISTFVQENIEIPNVGWDKGSKYFSTITFEKQAEEQGNWVAKKALEVLNGKDISKIDIVSNKKAIIYLNTSLVKKLNIFLPFYLMNDSILVEIQE